MLPPLPSRRVGLAVGGGVVAVGLLPILAALDILPSEKSSFHAPRWVVAVAGLAWARQRGRLPRRLRAGGDGGQLPLRLGLLARPPAVPPGRVGDPAVARAQKLKRRITARGSARTRSLDGNTAEKRNRK